MGSNTVMVSIRFPTEDRDLLQTVCKKRSEDVSGFIRRAVRTELATLGYYDGETMKALGVVKEA